MTGGEAPKRSRWPIVAWSLAAAVLIVVNNNIAIFIDTGLKPRSMKTHQGEQGVYLRQISSGVSNQQISQPHGF